MDAATRRSREHACIKNQQDAADAYELAASALAVALSASETNKPLWINAACDAQETAALQAQFAHDRLQGLLETESAANDGQEQRGESELNRPPSVVERSELCEENGVRCDRQAEETVSRIEPWIRAIGWLARLRARQS